MIGFKFDHHNQRGEESNIKESQACSVAGSELTWPVFGSGLGQFQTCRKVTV